MCKLKLLSLFLACSLLAACAPPQEEARKRFFWPPGFAAPKIEYINFYQAEQDVRRDNDNWLDEAVFGKSRPRVVFNRPTAIASDGKGRVFVADQATNQVLVWDFELNQLRFLKSARGGNFSFRLPAGIAVDGGGNVYVSDSQRKEILLFGPDEKLRRSLQGFDMQRPTGLAYDSTREKLYVVDTGAHQVLKISKAGELELRLGQRGVEAGEFNYPLDADVDAAGNLYVLDAMNARVQVFDQAGSFLRQFGERGTEIGSFQIPKSLSVSSSGQVYVTDSQAHRFVIFSLEGEHLASVGAVSPVVEGKVKPGGFYLPEGIDVDGNDAIWISDSLNRMFHQFQYLNADYLKKNPIRSQDAFVPEIKGVSN